MADITGPTASAISAPVNLVRMIRERFSYSIEDLAVASGFTVDELNGIEMGIEAEPNKLYRLAHSVGFRDSNADLH